MNYNPSLRHALQYFYMKTTVIKSGQCHNSSNGAIFLSIRNRIVHIAIDGQEGCNYFLMVGGDGSWSLHIKSFTFTTIGHLHYYGLVFARAA